MSLVLYTARFDSVPVIGCSPPSWAVWLACLEKGTSFEHHRLDFENDEHKSEPFLQLNPKGTLPALFDGGRLVSETRPMLECIQRQAGPSLLGETPEQRAHGMRMLSQANELKDAGMAWLSAVMRQKAEAKQLGVIYAEYLEKLSKTLSDGASSGNAFLAPANREASRPGLADLLAYAYVATTTQLQMRVDGFPAIGMWLRVMGGRDSVRTTRPSTWPD